MSYLEMTKSVFKYHRCSQRFIKYSEVASCKQLQCHWQVYLMMMTHKMSRLFWC